MSMGFRPAINQPATRGASVIMSATNNDNDVSAETTNEDDKEENLL